MFQSAKCPECAADIQVPTDRDTIKCMYCGKDISVKIAVGASSSMNVSNWMTLADAADDAGNHAEAYDYFTKILEIEPENYLAWLGKGLSAGWDAGLNGNRFSEMVAGVQRSIRHAPEHVREQIGAQAADEMNAITSAYFKLSIAHTREFISLDGTWSEHMDRCVPMLNVLVLANSLAPTNRTILGNAIELAKVMLEGVAYEDEFDTNDNGTKRTKVKHLHAELAEEVRTIMVGLVEKMKALDPTYAAPVIEKAGDMTNAVGCLAALVLGAGICFAIFWAIRSQSTSAPSPFAPQSAEIPATVTTKWCADLKARLEPRLLSDGKRLYPGYHDSFHRKVVDDYVSEKTYRCLQDVGQPTAGYWACTWDEHLDSPQKCERSAPSPKTTQGHLAEAPPSRTAQPLDSGIGTGGDPDSSAGGMVTMLVEHLKAPRTWRVQAAANGAKPRYDLPCTTSANGSFSCRDKCGENSGEIRVSPDTEKGPWVRTSDATQIILSFRRLCGRENERDVTYRVVHFSKDSFRLEGPHDWQVWESGER